MPAEFESGMFAGKPAWHGLGTVVEDAPNSAEAIKLAKLDWLVEQHQLLYKPEGATEPLWVPSHVVNVRNTDRAQLGVVGAGWTPLQNHEAFDFMDSLHQDGILKYESAGALKSGKIVWLLARADHLTFRVTKNDPSLTYFFMSMAHDGSRAVRIAPTAIRVVCWNTYSMVMRERTAQTHTIRHTSGLHDRLNQVRKMVELVEKHLKDTEKTFKEFSKLKLQTAQAREYFEHVVGEKPDPKKDPKAVARWEKLVGRMEAIYITDPRCSLDGMKETLWGGFNAVTQFVDWEIPSKGKDDQARNENRMNNVMFGNGQTMKTRALDKALEMISAG